MTDVRATHVATLSILSDEQSRQLLLLGIDEDQSTTKSISIVTQISEEGLTQDRRE